jgi:hypothetical protein
MKFIPVESSMVLGVRYDDARFELEIIFRTGEKYRYKNVPLFVYERLMSAESQGQYMRKYVLGRYDFERID